jgi:hypothetical protein
VLGVIAILIPGFLRIKEWAYAGLFFDLIGATYSVISIGAPAANWLFMALPIALAICSYVFYHKKLRAKLQSAKKHVHQSSNYFNEEKIKVAI